RLPAPGGEGDVAGLARQGERPRIAGVKPGTWMRNVVPEKGDRRRVRAWHGSSSRNRTVTRRAVLARSGAHLPSLPCSSTLARCHAPHELRYAAAGWWSGRGRPEAG